MPGFGQCPHWLCPQVPQVSAKHGQLNAVMTEESTKDIAQPNAASLEGTAIHESTVSTEILTVCYH